MERLAEGCGPSYYTYQVSRHSADVLQNLNQQRKSGGLFCDVVLRVGEDSFPAHRAVLAACSQYFESVLGEAEGPNPRELEMHTISSKVFGDILDFAYTARIVVRLESFPELMTAAKFLLMRSVIDICQEVIKQSNVHILVPPARPDLMLFRPGGATDLGFPLDMTNGAVLGGSGIAGSLGVEEEDSVRPGQAVPSQAPLLSLGGSPHMLHPQYRGGCRGWGEARPRKAKEAQRVGLCVVRGTAGGLRDVGVLPCGLCDKVFTDPLRLRQHEAQHGVTSLQLGYGDLQTPRLGENGMAQEELGTPRKRSRARKQVGCDLCGKIFRDVYHLNRHKLSHSGEKPYSCPVCGLRFKRKDRMSYHVRSHDGSVGKPYICQSCGKGFSRPDHLNGHIKQVHTSERPHKCEKTAEGFDSEVRSEQARGGGQTCNSSFATRDRLRSHLACHEDKVPCQVCGKYLRAAYMADHLKKHSEGPSNFCSICNRGFSSASYLKVHVKTHHGALLSAGPHRPESVPNGAALFHCVRTCGVKEGEKCPHGEQESSDSYGDLSDASDLKSPEKQTAAGAYAACDLVIPKKLEQEPEKRFPCTECGSFFRSRAYLSKHIQKVHARPLGAPLGDMGPVLGPALGPVLGPVLGPPLGPPLGPSLGPALGSALGSPFSPQQNMSLLESFGFQIVQSAFASSLVDPEGEQQGLGSEGK